MKKLVSLGLSLAMVVSGSAALFAGCGEGGSNSGPTDYDKTIVFYSTQSDALQQKTNIAIKRFESKFPGWKVSHVQPGGYDQVKEKIVSDLQANLQPDLAYCYPDHVAMYLETNQVIDMAPYISSTETVEGVVVGGTDAENYTIGFTADELADFVKGYYDEGYAENFAGYSQYGYSKTSMLTLPFIKSTELLYYNATALKKCGLQPATTWDEMWKQAPTIKKYYPKATVLGYDSEANWFITMCEQNGWGYTSADPANPYLFNSNNAGLKTWLGKLHDYWENGWLTTQEDYGSYTSGLFTKGAEDGGIIYCVGSSGGASHQEASLFQAECMPIPGSVLSDGTTVSKKVISQGPSLVMLKAGHDVSNADEKAKMTFLFLKELLDPTFQATFSIASGYNPCRPSTYEIEEYADHMAGTSMTAKACVAARQMTEDFFVSPAFKGSSTARTQVGNVLLYVMQGQKSADKALSDAYKNCGGK